MPKEKSSPEVTERHAQIVSDFPCVKKNMFGSQVYFAGDNMFTGTSGEGIILRLDAPDREAIQTQYDEVVPFTPNGRPMKEYVLIPAYLIDSDEFCSKWIAKSFEYAAALPPKVKK